MVLVVTGPRVDGGGASPPPIPIPIPMLLPAAPPIMGNDEAAETAAGGAGAGGAGAGAGAIFALFAAAAAAAGPPGGALMSRNSGSGKSASVVWGEMEAHDEK